jgi:hypothetical protein
VADWPTRILGNFPVGPKVMPMVYHFDSFDYVLGLSGSFWQSNCAHPFTSFPGRNFRPSPPLVQTINN